MKITVRIPIAWFFISFNYVKFVSIIIQPGGFAAAILLNMKSKFWN